MPPVLHPQRMKNILTLLSGMFFCPLTDTKRRCTFLDVQGWALGQEAHGAGGRYRVSKAHERISTKIWEVSSERNKRTWVDAWETWCVVCAIQILQIGQLTFDPWSQRPPRSSVERNSVHRSYKRGCQTMQREGSLFVGSPSSRPDVSCHSSKSQFRARTQRIPF